MTVEEFEKLLDVMLNGGSTLERLHAKWELLKVAQGGDIDPFKEKQLELANIVVADKFTGNQAIDAEDILLAYAQYNEQKLHLSHDTFECINSNAHRTARFLEAYMKMRGFNDDTLSLLIASLDFDHSPVCDILKAYFESKKAVIPAECKQKLIDLTLKNNIYAREVIICYFNNLKTEQLDKDEEEFCIQHLKLGFQDFKEILSRGLSAKGKLTLLELLKDGSETVSKDAFDVLKCCGIGKSKGDSDDDVDMRVFYAIELLDRGVTIVKELLLSYAYSGKNFISEERLLKLRRMAAGNLDAASEILREYNEAHKGY